jgi:hypothetical protein
VISVRVGKGRVKQASAVWGILFVLASTVVATGCGDNISPESLVPASANPRRNVMVIDEGFDLSVREFHGRVAAAYTERCRATDDSGTPAAATADADGGADGGSFADLKRQVIADLAIRDDSCHLEKGVSAKADPMASIDRFRTRWNDALRGGKSIPREFTQDERNQLLAPLMAELESFSFHGTATAGTIAHDNPDVRLVLVERELGSDASLAATFTCLSQADFDQMRDLLADPDVYAAYVNRPASTLDSDLADVTATFNVGLVNQSFGVPPRAAIEKLQAMNGCPPLDLASYFALQSQVDRAHAQALGGPPRLVISSAGNDGVQIDGPADSQTCAPGDPASVVVGSYDLVQRHSTFTNFGACVDVYAPGEWIVASYAGGWLLPVFGTSFSAPLVARLVSLSAPDPFLPEQARTSVLSRRFSDGALPIGLFPNDFFYTAATGFNPTFSLTAGGAGTAGSAAIPQRTPVSARIDLRRARMLLRIGRR